MNSVEADQVRWHSFAAGAIDGLVFLSYVFTIDQSIYYSATILLKIWLLALRRRPVAEGAHSALPFLCCLAGAELISGLINEVELISTIRILVFCINLFVTLNFVGTAYWRGLALSSLVGALTYLLAVEGGRIPSVFGRYLYFSLSQPNLGAEILFGGAFASLMAKMPRSSLGAIVLFFVPAFLMQGRAAELGILCAGGILGWETLRSQPTAVRLTALVMLGGAGLVLLYTFDVFALIDKVLLLNDEYRGESTSASGRDRYWASAMEVWLQNPIFGAGSDYISRLGYLQPHNFFLYPLAYYGFLGVVVLAVFMQRLLSVFFSARTLNILPFVPMLAFNDRFVNLNVYPMVLFLYVFHEYPKLRKSTK